VTERYRVIGGRSLPLQVVDVAPTDARGLEIDANLVRGRFRNLDVLDPQVVFSVVACGSHTTSPPREVKKLLSTDRGGGVRPRQREGVLAAVSDPHAPSLEHVAVPPTPLDGGSLRPAPCGFDADRRGSDRSAPGESS